MKREKLRLWFRSGPGIALAILMGFIGIIVIAFLFGYVVMALWNWLMPALFGLKTITFWQAFVMIILAKILFGRMGPGGGGPGRWRHRHHPMADGEGCRDPETWYVKGGWGKWKYYNEYWKDEGKAAFEKYIEKMESNKSPSDPE